MGSSGKHDAPKTKKCQWCGGRFEFRNSRQRFGFRGVDTLDARVRVRTVDNGSVQQPGRGEVGAVEAGLDAGYSSPKAAVKRVIEQLDGESNLTAFAYDTPSTGQTTLTRPVTVPEIRAAKAAGMSIRLALREMYPGEFYEAPTDHMHMQGRLIRDLVLGKFAFSRIRWFAVRRNPVHTIWASYMRTRQIAAKPKRRGFSKQYCEYLDRFLTYKSCDEYARDAWLNPDRHLRHGGLWQKP